MRLIPIILVAFLLGGVFSCSPQKRLNRKLKRAERFAKKHGLTIMDTVRITDIDTFIVNSVTHDTTTQLIHHDSVTVINNERVKLIYKHDTITNEIWHHVECKGDTIIQREEHTITNEKIKYMPQESSWIDYAQRILLLILLIYLAARLILKK